MLDHTCKTATHASCMWQIKAPHSAGRLMRQRSGKVPDLLDSRQHFGGLLSRQHSLRGCLFRAAVQLQVSCASFQWVTSPMPAKFRIAWVAPPSEVGLRVYGLQPVFAALRSRSGCFLHVVCRAFQYSCSSELLIEATFSYSCPLQPPGLFRQHSNSSTVGRLNRLCPLPA